MFIYTYIDKENNNDNYSDVIVVVIGILMQVKINSVLWLICPVH